MKTSVYVRAATLRPLQAPRVKSSQGHEIVLHLTRIGNNLNQLVKRSNTYGQVDSRELSHVLAEVLRATSTILLDEEPVEVDPI